MTDNEIIIPLKCLVMNESDCRHCKLKDKNDKCQKFLYSDVLGLIDENNRQKAEIERLQNKVEELSEVLSDTIRIRYAEAKAEAVKEFEERAIKNICEKVYAPTPVQSCIVEKCNQVIIEIAKEMVGADGD